ncbi:MAG: hypothetical protein PHP28_04190 [Actinomycetota bacterium]|nr:hypothetical protein [Actinomycetota bacterium]MDD5665759.1 hypothetical protein [Actinomycetota bacterium]
MGKIRKCRQCGVPLGVGRDLVWHGNGVITQAKDPDHRMVFYESDFLDALFADLGELTGMPIEPVVIESKRRMTRDYMERQFTPFTRRIMHRLGPNLMSKRISRMGRHYGYGDIRPDELRSRGDDDDYQVVSIRHPYSLLLFCGDTVGSKEAMDGREFKVSWEETGEHEYTVTFKVGEHPVQLPAAARRGVPTFKPGEMAFKRCASCGVPLGVSRSHWDLEAGVIHDPGTGRRMAIFSPDSIEVVLRDIEEELGDDIAEMVIEDQRRYVRRMLGREDALMSWRNYREMAGLRGLGYVRDLDVGERHCRVLIENPCLTLFMVGIIQAFFEMGTGHESLSRRWETLPDGDLFVEISA